MNPDIREKAARVVTELCNMHICLELKQKSLINFFVIHTNLLWTDFILVSMDKNTGSTEVLKVGYSGIVTNCLEMECFCVDFICHAYFLLII